MHVALNPAERGTTMNAHATPARRLGAGSDDPPPDRASRATIVLVEDDEDVRFVCAEALRDRGFVVDECATLAAVRTVLAGALPDVLLLDRELPDGCGLDLARWLRARATYDGVRIVAFSGRTAPDEIEEAFNAGCDAFVAKPCTSSALGLEIERLLARIDAGSDDAPGGEPPAESEIRHVGSAERRRSTRSSAR
jgi:DNA-binding response OmpR family regulator